MTSVLRAVHSADAPTERISSTSVSVSRIRGTFSSVTGCSVSSAAAMIGSAEFFVAGRLDRAREPVTALDDILDGRHLGLSLSCGGGAGLEAETTEN
ncbi:hypothetical protein ACVWXO_002687 [Bradyrhizobium sp. LM2.7]